MPSGKPVAMEIDVPRFIAQDQPAHFGEGPIAHVAPEHTVVTRANDFDDEQHEHLELNPQSTPNGIEKLKTEGAGDEFAADAPHRASEQARVFALFGKPQIDDGPRVRNGAAKNLRVAGDE